MADFKHILTNFAESFNWDTAEIGDDSALFVFQAESGNEQTLYVTLNDEMVEFDVPSAGVFPHEEDIPADISTRLLKRNAMLSVGGWAIEEIEDQWCFSLMWNEGLDELEKMEPDDFGAIIGTLIEECDQFDRSLEEEA